MSDPAIGDTIIAAIGSEDTPLLQMAAVVAGLERAGFKIIPRAQYKALTAAAKPVSKEKVLLAARAIGRTADDLGEGCDEPCETDGGTCICIELHYDQALAALRAAGIETEE